MSKLRVLETFSGIGAQHKALDFLKNEGSLDEYEIVGTSEWDIWANISYNAIHHNNLNIAVNLSDREINDFLLRFTHSNDSKTPMTNQQVLNLPRIIRENLYSAIKNANNLGSITEINADKIIERINDFDLLTYSFPCQDLSTAGNFHNTNKGMKKDSGTRSGLLWEIERILNELKLHNKLPKYLLLENVNNMISKQHVDDYIEWLNFLSSIGYNTQTYKLDATDYGGAQNRKRTFALSVRNDLNVDFADTFNKNNQRLILEYSNPVDISQSLKLKTKIEQILKQDYQNSIYRSEAEKATPNKTKSRKKIFNENRVLSSHIKIEPHKASHVLYQSGDIYYSETSSTITTKQDRHPNGGVINLKQTSLADQHNLKMDKLKANFRFLTPRECFLLMGFEERDYDNILWIREQIRMLHPNKNYLSETVLYRQSGNSIVVNILTAIFNKIIELEKENHAANRI